MTLVKWTPMTELDLVHDELDRLMGGFWREFELPTATVMPLMPVVDVMEKGKNVVMKAELPGVSKDDLQVTATEDSLTLAGEFKQDEGVEEEGYYRKERRYGQFYRQVPMPAAINPDKVKASFKDGVLEVTARKASPTRTKEKKIEVEA